MGTAPGSCAFRRKKNRVQSACIFPIPFLSPALHTNTTSLELLHGLGPKDDAATHATHSGPKILGFAFLSLVFLLGFSSPSCALLTFPRREDAA